MPKPRILASRTVAAIQHAHDLSDAAHAVLWAAIDDEYDDGTAIVVAARAAADAAQQLLDLYGATGEFYDEAAPFLIGKYRTFALSSILSIVTGKMVAQGGPDAVAELLSWMTGHPFKPADLRSPLADVAAARCRSAILEQHPKINTQLPAVPRVKLSDTTETVHQPPVIAAWVEIVAVDYLNRDGPDPLLHIAQLPAAVQKVFA